jgi:sugar phosphate isomerase/epimerase
MPDRFRTAAITDEFTSDFESAIQSMASVGMTGAELRMLWGKNIVDLSDEELDRAIQIARNHGMEIISIASPVLKCVLPDAPAVDERFQQDSFASKHTFEDQPRLTARAFEIAARTGARIIRVFSYWRTIDPAACFDRIVEALKGLADQAASRGVTIGIENEHACNIGTGVETARVLAALDHPNLKVVWDPANTFVAGEEPMQGFAKLPVARIAHVHAKDCTVRDHKATWLELGTGAIPWSQQIDGLERGGYNGWISLETHWPGPNGDKQAGSVICGQNLKRMVS